MRWTGHYLIHVEEMRNVGQVHVGKYKGGRSLMKRRGKREDDVQVNLKELGFEGVGQDWHRIVSSSRHLSTQ
jgi:hypothetical protein